MQETAPRWWPARLAYGFYGVAAAGAVIGQTWVALTHIPWGSGVHGWVRVAAVLPFALCLELLAMALAAMGDERMRLGEHAYGFRVFSALVATVAVGILVVGHWPHYYWSASFGVLSTSAYLLWLLHSAARRRDALRAAGKLADTAPDYGLWRRLRHPIWTASAAELARHGHTDPTGTWRPLSLYESLHAAQLAIRADKRRPALARAVEQVVRADHPDPRMADIAVHTLDLDRIATELERRVDYPAWADRLAPAITAPAIGLRNHQRREAHASEARTRADGERPARGRHPGRRTRIAVRRGRGGGTLAADTPITPARPAAQRSLPAAARGSAEHAYNGALVNPVAYTVPILRRHAPSGVRHAPRSTDPRRAADAASCDGAATATPPLADPLDTDTEPGTIAAKTAAQSETAAAVAYWRERQPRLHPSEIAERVGRSERHVRRILATLDTTEPDHATVNSLTETHR